MWRQWIKRGYATVEVDVLVIRWLRLFRSAFPTVSEIARGTKVYNEN